MSEPEISSLMETAEGNWSKMDVYEKISFDEFSIDERTRQG